MAGLFAPFLSAALAVGSQAASSKATPSLLLQGVVRDFKGDAVNDALVSVIRSSPTR